MPDSHPHCRWLPIQIAALQDVDDKGRPNEDVQDVRIVYDDGQEVARIEVSTPLTGSQ
jgi:hypothetical protein